MSGMLSGDAQPLHINVQILAQRIVVDFAPDFDRGFVVDALSGEFFRADPSVKRYILSVSCMVYDL